MAAAGGQFRVRIGKRHIFQNLEDEFGELIAVKLEVNITLHHAAQQLLQGQVEIEQFAHVLAGLKMRRQAPADFGDPADERDQRLARIIAVPP